jgi:hypothetical protein
MTDNAEPEVVARLRFPIGVGGLGMLTDALMVAYGPDLRLVADGDHLLVLRP